MNWPFTVLVWPYWANALAAADEPRNVLNSGMFWPLLATGRRLAPLLTWRLARGFRHAGFSYQIGFELDCTPRCSGHSVTQGAPAP